MTQQIHIVYSLYIPVSEVQFHFSRSGGPGGQNVNKVATRVELRFDVKHSWSLDDVQRLRILSALKSKIDSRGILRIAAEGSRSQWRNREEALRKFVAALRKALRERRKRIGTKPTAASRVKRRFAKSHRSETKKLRGRVSPDL